ncbi:MAG: NAD(P)/FAD-dependent oxidoreductase [Firmicutes bacterium]|nr:NAD(P)/FAD-dependent oxidoreductase [Bacillota bacterium]
MIRTKYAIVGGGPAALYAAAAIRERDLAGRLVIIGAEGHPPYFRPLISYYLAGLVPRENLFMQDAEYYRQKKIEMIGGKVTEVRGQEKVLVYQPLGEGRGDDAGFTPDSSEKRTAQHLQFEKLLIASGGTPGKPDLPGIDTPGVYFLRTIEDAEKIAARAKGSQKALLWGGGLVSLKAAYALYRLGLEITLVIASDRILSQMLDRKGAEIVASYLAEKGLKMILQSDLQEVHGNSRGVTAVTLTGGRELKTDLIVIGKGVQPSVSFLEGSGIKEKGGVEVDERLQTNLPDIYAAGDVVLCRDLLQGIPVNNALWPNATAQGECAGANMTGERLTYRGSISMNAAEFFGLPVISAGLGRAQEGAGVDQDQPRKSDRVSSKEEIAPAPAAGVQPREIYKLQKPTPSRREPHYLRLVFEDECLVGYVAIGKNRKAGMLTNLITARFPLAPQQKERLISGDLAFPFSI